MSDIKIKKLIQLYQSKQYDAAEKLAKSLTKKFPKHPFAWKVLGALLGQAGRTSEAFNIFQNLVSLTPQDTEAHYNLGLSLKELGRLHEAEKSFSQAILLNPNYANAYNNLGITLKELGRLQEAEASYKQAILLNPNYANAYNNLGNTLKELGRLQEAEESYKQAIVLKSDYAEAHNNLGSTLINLGRLQEAEESYKQAIVLKSDYAEAMYNLSITLSHMNNLKAEIILLRKILQMDTDDYGLRAGVSLAICNFLEGDFSESKKQVLAAQKIQEKMLLKFKPERLYQVYLFKILKWHEYKYQDVDKDKNDKYLYVLGESHSLTSHHLRIQNSGINFFCSARLIKGCKQWHLGNAYKNQYKHQFESIFYTLPKHSYLLLAIGEIDCRLDSGIIAHKKKFPEKQIKEIIITTVENYLTYIISNNSNCQHKIVIQGVPCPNIDIKNHAQKDIKQLVEVINIFNSELKAKSKENAFGFLDVHKLTDNGDGLSNNVWQIDSNHLSPDGMLEAWRQYNC